MNEFKQQLIKNIQYYVEYFIPNEMIYEIGHLLVPDFYYDSYYKKVEAREVNYAAKIKSSFIYPYGLREFFTWRGWGNQSFTKKPVVFRAPFQKPENHWLTLSCNDDDIGDYLTQRLYCRSLSEKNPLSGMGRKHGWLFPYLIGVAELLHNELESNRWFTPLRDMVAPDCDFFLYKPENFTLCPPAKLHFNHKETIQEHLEKILTEIVEPRLSKSEDLSLRLKAIEFLIDWLLWSAGHPDMIDFESHSTYNNPKDHPLVWANLYDIFWEKRLIHALMINPYDYLGELIRPCLPLICPDDPDIVLMDFDTIRSYIKENYLHHGLNAAIPFVDPEIYTGRYLMVAGDYTHGLMGTTAYPLLGKIAWLNCLLYCPEVIFPLSLTFNQPNDISDAQIKFVLESKKLSPETFFKSHEFTDEQCLAPFGMLIQDVNEDFCFSLPSEPELILSFSDNLQLNPEPKLQIRLESPERLSFKFDSPQVVLAFQSEPPKVEIPLRLTLQQPSSNIVLPSSPQPQQTLSSPNSHLAALPPATTKEPTLFNQVYDYETETLPESRNY